MLKDNFKFQSALIPSLIEDKNDLVYFLVSLYCYNVVKLFTP